MRAFEILLEAGDNSYPVEFMKQSGRTAYYMFKTDAGLKYYVTFSVEKGPRGKRGANLVFSVDKPTGLSKIKDQVAITGTGDQFRVMASVGQAIRQYIAAYDPEFITFTAREPSRISLYNYITRNIGRYISGWTRGKTIPMGNYTVYLITKRI